MKEKIENVLIKTIEILSYYFSNNIFDLAKIVFVFVSFMMFQTLLKIVYLENTLIELKPIYAILLLFSLMFYGLFTFTVRSRTYKIYAFALWVTFADSKLYSTLGTMLGVSLIIHTIYLILRYIVNDLRGYAKK